MDERVSHQEGVNDCLRSAAQLHEAKLRAVEEAYAKHNTRIQGLRRSTYTAAAAGSPAPTGATDPTDLAAVHERLDQLSRNALENHDKFKETQDKFVTLHIAVQSMQLDGLSESHLQFAQGMDYFRAESEKTSNRVSPRALQVPGILPRHASWDLRPSPEDGRQRNLREQHSELLKYFRQRPRPLEPSTS